MHLEEIISKLKENKADPKIIESLEKTIQDVEDKSSKIKDLNERINYYSWLVDNLTKGHLDFLDDISTKITSYKSILRSQYFNN